MILCVCFDWIINLYFRFKNNDNLDLKIVIVDFGGKLGLWVFFVFLGFCFFGKLFG